MDKETCINKVLRDVRMAGIVDEVGTARLRPHMEILASAVYEIVRKSLASRNKRKVVQYNLHGVMLGEYDSIREAGIAVGYKNKYRFGELIIGNVLNGRHHHTRAGHIWKYKT